MVVILLKHDWIKLYTINTYLDTIELSTLAAVGCVLTALQNWLFLSFVGLDQAPGSNSWHTRPSVGVVAWAVDHAEDVGLVQDGLLCS